MTFNNIQPGDFVLAAYVMQNFMHVNYGNTLVPVNASGVGVDNTLDLGSTSFRWRGGYFSTNLNSYGIFNSYLTSGVGESAAINIERQGGFGGSLFYGYYDSGSDYGIRLKDSGGRLIFETNGANGNIGLGETNPSIRLLVSGDTGMQVKGQTGGGIFSIKPYITGHLFHEITTGSNESLQINLGINASLSVNSSVTISGSMTASQPRCKVTNSAQLTLTNGVNITWDTETYDTANMHSTSSNTDRLIAVVAGVYIISVFINTTKSGNPGNAVFEVALKRYNSGGTLQETIVTTDTFQGSSNPYPKQIDVGAVVACSLNDYVVAEVVTGGSADVMEGSIFQFTKIS